MRVLEQRPSGVCTGFRPVLSQLDRDWLDGDHDLIEGEDNTPILISAR
jgi:hypothetical protein